MCSTIYVQSELLCVVLRFIEMPSAARTGARVTSPGLRCGAEQQRTSSCVKVLVSKYLCQSACRLLQHAMANYARIAKQVQAAAAKKGSVAARAKHDVEQQRLEAAAELEAQQEWTQEYAEVLKQRRLTEEARLKKEQEAHERAERERRHVERLQQAEARREAEQARAVAQAEIQSMLQQELASLPSEEEPTTRSWMQNVYTDRGRLLGQQSSALEGAMQPGESQADAAARLIDELRQGRLEVEALRSAARSGGARNSGIPAPGPAVA